MNERTYIDFLKEYFNFLKNLHCKNNMKQIQLYNRDGADLKLVQIEGNTYQLTVDKEHDYILEYCRIGVDNPTNPNYIKESEPVYTYIDPVGGPFIHLGLMLGLYKVKKILISNSTINVILEKQN